MVFLRVPFWDHLLFILYVNDLCNVSDVLQFILFADDTNIFCYGKDSKALENIINTELRHVNTWFSVNQLSLNIKKTKYIIFGHKIGHADFSIHINNTPIERFENY